MTLPSHLRLTEIALLPGAEWSHDRSAWLLVRLGEGHGYWLCKKEEPREIKPGEALVIPPGGCGLFRASQLGAVTLHYFSWQPELLTGILSLSERHFFANIGLHGNLAARVLPASPELAGHFEGSDCEAEPTLVCRSKLLQFIGETFGEEISRQSPPSAKAFQAADRFEVLIRQLTDSDLLNFTPSQLARRCGCSLRHFGRLFYNRFGLSLRARQTRLRLQKAGLLLSDSGSKVINVALESGYRNLGLFNKTFKKHTGMTPSQWRKRASEESRSSKSNTMAFLMTLFMWLAVAQAHAATPGQTNAPAAVPANAGPAFKVTAYQVEGNTVLTTNIIADTFVKYVGDAVNFDTIKKALTDLQMAYRQRGFVTVRVGLPQQQITNGIVRVVVTEGKLADVTIINNNHFSSNNIMRALPSAQTNTLLNSLAFQQELDRANANRDRQIYPELAPGPETGTSSLRLKVKDRLPLHANAELNNQATPGTPDLRFNLAAQYNNLWQMDHQIGVQYLFSPEEFKDSSPLVKYFFDEPLIASYSGFYRMPLSSLRAQEPAQPLTSSSFGYDEATHRFRPPAMAGPGPELVMYASRSVSDTGLQLQSQTLDPSDAAVQKAGGGLQISDSRFSQTLTFNEDIGFRLNQGLKGIDGIDSSLSYGLDYKAFRSYANQTAAYQASLWVPDGKGGFDKLPSPPYGSRLSTPTSVNYLPLSLNWDASKGDKWGLTTFNLYNTANFTALSSSSDSDFSTVAQTETKFVPKDKRATGNFYVLNAGAAREQKIYGQYEVSLRANGQWGSQTLIGNEQFALGGLSGPRGYREGEDYGDAGWRVSVEPHTPLFDLGMVDGTMPMRVRFSVFTDYGERYIYTPKTTTPDGMPTADFAPTVRMLGTGFGVTGTIGSTIDFRAALAFPLLSTAAITAGTPRIYFGVSAHF